MAYTVSSGTLNYTIPYHTTVDRASGLRSVGMSVVMILLEIWTLLSVTRKVQDGLTFWYRLTQVVLETGGVDPGGWVLTPENM